MNKQNPLVEEITSIRVIMGEVSPVYAVFLIFKEVSYSFCDVLEKLRIFF